MALRAIRINDDPILRRRCKEVPVVNECIRRYLDDMADTLHVTDNGAAIAAPQVGIGLRLVVIDLGELSGGVLKLVNPKIVASEGEQLCDEGCLSFPDRWAKTLRPQKVSVEALNEQGLPIRLTGEGLMAQCFCHELEHLDGVVFLDHAVSQVVPVHRVHSSARNRKDCR